MVFTSGMAQDMFQVRGVRHDPQHEELQGMKSISDKLIHAHFSWPLDPYFSIVRIRF